MGVVGMTKLRSQTVETSTPGKDTTMTTTTIRYVPQDHSPGVRDVLARCAVTTLACAEWKRSKAAAHDYVRAFSGQERPPYCYLRGMVDAVIAHSLLGIGRETRVIRLVRGRKTRISTKS